MLHPPCPALAPALLQAGRLVALLACAVLAACASAPPLPPEAAQLLAEEPVAANPAVEPPEAVLGASDAMRRYVQQDMARAVRLQGKQRALIDALRSPALRLEYDASQTRNAANTFEHRSGNCLSLVLMTAALARELGLTVDYRSAWREEAWSRVGDTILISGHVNLVVGRRATDSSRNAERAETTIDFLPPQELHGLVTRSIDERTVVAMYYNNRAAEALTDGQLDAARTWARAAVHQQPRYAAGYNTLGVVALRQGSAADAARAFRVALALVPKHVPSMTNLAQAYAAQGLHEQAQALRTQAAALQPEPPYHFFRLGQAAAEQGDWRRARELFATEVRRASYSAEFHYWLGLANYRLGDWDAAQRELAQAAELGNSRNERALYGAKLAWLKQARSTP